MRIVRSIMILSVLVICGLQAFSESYYAFDMEWGAKGTNIGEFVHGPSDLAIGVDENVYVTDTGGSQVHVFTKDGAFLMKWPTYEVVSSETNIFMPDAITIDTIDRVIISRMGQTDSAVIVYNVEGTYIDRIVEHGDNVGQTIMPQELTVDTKTNLYVAELMGRIQIFDPAGNALLAFGSDGSGDNEFQGIGGLAIDDMGTIYVADLMGSAVKIFSANGIFVDRWDINDIELLGGITLDQYRNVILGMEHNMLILRPDGEIIGVIDDIPHASELFEPHRMAVNSEGDLFVIDSANARIVKFAPTVSGPPVVSEPTSTNISSSTATLGGTVTDDGGGTIIERGIFWSIDEDFTSPSEGIKVSETGEFGVGVFTVEVTELASTTQIYFRAFARHIATSGYSDEASFSKPEGEGVIFVNSVFGDDAYSGYSPTVSGMSGPKATLDGAMAIATTGDTIDMAEGDYPELPLTLNLDGRDITLRTSGSVTITQEE